MKFEKITVAQFKKITSSYNIGTMSELQNFITSFIESGVAIAEIKDWKVKYCEVYGVASSINSSAKRHGQDNVRAVVRNKKPYIINKLLFTEEIKKC